MCDNGWDFYPDLLKRLTPEEKRKLNGFIDDVYIDGWTDGNCHKGGLTPIEHQARITEDLECSWWRLIAEYDGEFGPQKSPSSVAKVNAESRQIKKMMEDE